MELVSLEQLEVLMLIASSEEPMAMGVAVRQRWRYILAVAQCAQRGAIVDRSLPQVVADCDRWVARAEAVLSALDDWLHEQSDRSASDKS